MLRDGLAADPGALGTRLPVTGSLADRRPRMMTG